MNGPQDMGGSTGFGPVVPEPDEPVFHSEWERRALALTLAMGMTGTWNIDTSRHARERTAPADYWSLSYYEIWIKGLERLLTEHRLASPAELDQGRSLTPPKPVTRVATAAVLPNILAKGGPSNRPSDKVAAFAVGDTIRIRNLHPKGHTRLPGYLRGHVGEIVMVHGTHVFPDSAAHGLGDDPHWLYAVRFKALEVFGNASHDTITADLWEPYLEKAA